MIREPEPVPAGSTLIFPDFALRYRPNPAGHWLLEIVGFWPLDYVARKLALYRSARLSNLILCIDEEVVSRFWWNRKMAHSSGC